MSSARELLALRREVLVARVSLQRLKTACELQALRESLAWPRAVATLAAPARARAVLFGLLLLMAGHGRLARFVRGAAAAVALARLAGTLARSPKEP